MATTGDTQPSQKTFRFFDLHRELRDITYEELKCAVPVNHKHNADPSMRASLEAIDPVLRLVNRQFRHEVDTIVSRNDSKLEREHGVTGHDFDCIGLNPWIAKLVGEVQLRLLLPQCGCQGCLQGGLHTSYEVRLLLARIVESVKNLPHLKQTHICFLLTRRDEVMLPIPYATLRSKFEAFLEIEGLATLEFRGGDSQLGTLLASWVQKEGWRDLLEPQKPEVRPEN